MFFVNSTYDVVVDTQLRILQHEKNWDSYRYNSCSTLVGLLQNIIVQYLFFRLLFLLSLYKKRTIDFTYILLLKG